MESNTGQSSNVGKIVGGIVAVLLCCTCAVILAAGYILFQTSQQIPSDLPTLLPPIENPSPTPEIEHPTPSSGTISTGTLETLQNTLVPENDPYELACRLQNICNVPVTVPSKQYTLGDQETFWVTNVDTTTNFQTTTTLRYVGDHIYFWIENGVRYDESDLRRLSETFEEQMYPTNREFFGSEPSPGVDQDPRIHLLFVRGTGASNAGYFSTPDAYNPLVKEYSNGHEMFVFNADNLDLGGQETYGVLAHEFQHMIHFNTDRNEATWVNEGFSMVAELLNGYPIYFDYYYIVDPDLNLTDWSPNPGSNGAHYGQSFLYLAYLLDRFGEDATKDVVSHPENGLEAIDLVLAELNITDPLTGQGITADDVFMDWAATMRLMDESVGDGRFHYNNYPDAPRIVVSESVSSCPGSTSGSVNQYGIDYFTITCRGDYTLKFNGSTLAKLLPADANSGKYSFWSNKGDESDMTLTREFDLTNASAPITLSYSMWYDLETDYDYVFVEASTDGETWEILTTPSCTSEDPSGNSFGCGYNAQTGDWVQEDVDLSKFAGQKVQIRFEYITDAAVNGEGFLIDDVRVDAINYTTDFEADDGGWVAAGFARVENVLPQTYRLSLIIKGDETTVTHIPVYDDQTAEYAFSLGSGDEAILIVTGTTRYTRIPAAYKVEIR
jgi:immune inhibitor A